MNCLILIFSKDRALQLDATLRSLLAHCSDIDKSQVCVLFTTSDSSHDNQYSLVKNEFRPYSYINFVREENFHSDVIALLAPYDYVLFLVDDNIFVRDFSLAEAINALQTHPDAVGFSLRLGENTTYCYPLDKQEHLPDFQPLGHNVLKYNWTSAEHDFGYPLELSSSAYRTEDMVPFIAGLPFENPNILESHMAANASFFKESKPFLLCFNRSVTFCVPFNKVQSVFASNRTIDNTEYSADNLAKLFRDGNRIDVTSYEGFLSNACHQEVELKLVSSSKTPLGKGTQEEPPAVSVIIPCYNQAQYLPEAVESVVNQIYTNWECIIVNDGSPDDTSEVARKLIAQCPDKRIVLLEKENGGLPSARNSGIQASRGKYILPLDADDKIAPGFLEKTVKVLEERQDVGFVYSHIQHFGELNNLFELPEFDADIITYIDNIACVCSLFRKEVWERIGGYNESMREGYEDWDLWVSFVEKGWSGYRIPEPLFYYRIKKQSMLRESNIKRPFLIARIIGNHPNLYDEKTQEWARGIVESKKRLPELVSPVNQKKLSITYLIESILGVTGGNQTLLSQVNALVDRGHQVTIVTHTGKPQWFGIKARVIQIPESTPMAPHVPPSDVVISTYFVNTAELQRTDAPVKIYYAQGDQFIFEDDDTEIANPAIREHRQQLKRRSRESYLLPGVRFVANSRNLAHFVEMKYGRRADAILPVCINQNIFRPLHRQFQGAKRILVVGPDVLGGEVEPLGFKGILEIRHALEMLSQKTNAFTVLRMSNSEPYIFKDFPCEFYMAPNDHMKTFLYGTSHILVYASHYDSCPRPPLEAMASGTAVVCTRTSGALEYCRDGENSLLVPTGSPEAISNAVYKLMTDQLLWNRLVTGGFQTARQFPQEREWNELETLLYKFMEESGATKMQTSLSASAKPRRQGLTSIILMVSGNDNNLHSCLESIRSHTPETYEIIFVPVGSDNPPKWLRKKVKGNNNYKLVKPNVKDSRGQGVKGSRGKYLNPRSLESSNPVSYAHAWNVAIKESSGEYIVILRDTVVVTEGWLTGILECINSTADTGIVGPMTVNVEGPQEIRIKRPRGQGAKDSKDKGSRGQGFKGSNKDFQKKIHSNPRTLESLNPVSLGTLESIDPEELDAFAKEFRERNRYRRVGVMNLDSFCILFRHELTEKIGLFDEGFETDKYACDDYCIKAAVEGLKNLIAGDVFVHYYGRSPAVAAKDRIALAKKWSDIDLSKPETRKIYCTNAIFAADELNQKGQRQKAVDTLTEAIKSYPDDPRLRYALAETLIEEKKYKEAMDLLEQHPTGSTKDEKSLELTGTCKIYMGLSEDAGKYADEILLSNSASPKGWDLKGTVAFQKGSYAEAEKFFQKAIESDRGFGEAYANIGALRWAAGNKKEALRLFEKAFILSPTVEDIVTNYYTAVVSLSKLHEAEAVFKEAIALHPLNRRIKFILVDDLLQQKKYNEAMTAIEEAMDIFGIDDDTLSLALKLRDLVGPMEINKSQGSRIRGFEDSSESRGAKHSSPGTLGSSNPSVSLCMIVKNEEKNIARCLMSVKPVVDEMIVVDTGSSDRTKKIAKVFGAKVYDIPWMNDFSSARNFSLSKASGDWILILDADEAISPSDYEKLSELITPPSPPLAKGGRKGGIAYSFITRNYVGPVCAHWHPNAGTYKEEAGSGWFPSGKVRLFSNDDRIRFERPVHETVENSLPGAGCEVGKSYIPIHHYGRLVDKDEIQAKGRAYYQLGKMKLAEEGEQNPEALYELAVQASELENYEEAIEIWRKLIAVKPDIAKAYYGMGTNCHQLGRYEEARAAYQKAVELDPGSKDAVVMYATSELLFGNADVAVSYIEALLKGDPEYTLAFLAATAAYLCAGRKEKGYEYIQKVAHTTLRLAPYLSDIARLMISVRRFDYATALLEAAVETNNTTDETRKMLDECRNRQAEVKAQTETEKKKLLTPQIPEFPNSFFGAPGTLESSNPAVLQSDRQVIPPSPPLAKGDEGGFSDNISAQSTLSLCMIVKNEEENIGRALMSVKPVVDEMIVVDTGSTDRTKEIAHSLGAKVYDFRWNDNFADARNFSISKATGKWILILDADEVISAQDHEKLKELIRDPRTLESSNPVFESSSPAVAYSFVTRTYVTDLNTIGWTANDGHYMNEQAGTGWFPGEKARLFPNDGRIRFDFPIHERVEPSLIKAGIETGKCDIPVHHYGNFVKKEKAHSKAVLYYQLGKEKLKEQGEMNFMAFYELAIQGIELGQHEEALGYLEKVIAMRPTFPKAYQSTGNIYYNLRRYEEALPYYKKALELDPGARDTVLMLATTEILSGNAKKSIPLLDRFFGTEPSYPQALLVVAEAYFCLEKRQEGLKYVRQLKDMLFDAERHLTEFGKILIRAGRFDYAVSLLQSAIETGNATDEATSLLAECRKMRKGKGREN